MLNRLQDLGELALLGGVAPKIKLEDVIIGSGWDPRDIITGDFASIVWSNQRGRVLLTGQLSGSRDTAMNLTLGLYEHNSGVPLHITEVSWAPDKTLVVCSGEEVLDEDEKEANQIVGELLANLGAANYAQLRFGLWLADLEISRESFEYRVWEAHRDAEAHWERKDAARIGKEPEEPKPHMEAIRIQLKQELQNGLVDAAIEFGESKEVIALGLGHTDRFVRELWMRIALGLGAKAAQEKPVKAQTGAKLARRLL